MASRLPDVPDSIALPRGFSAAGMHCGLKAKGALDLGLLLADRAVHGAAIYTRNELLGAHIHVCRDHLQRSGGLVRAVLVNSRNANCATGEQGIEDASTCCRALAERLGCPEEQVLMASTGPIGAPLPKQRILDHLDALLEKAGPTGGMDFARAIMTTDTHPKAVAGGGRDDAPAVTGFTKGSGMIHPDMATMLGFLLSDGGLGDATEDRLRWLADRSFHCVTVDGDTSPNDTLFLLGGTDPEGPADERALLDVSCSLARQLAGDGEGATRLITIEVRGCAEQRDAAHIGRTIATSALVKTAVAGRDPNWGRILAAAGRAGVPFETDAARVWIGETEVFRHGRPFPEREKDASRHLRENECVVIGIDLGVGDEQADVWSCDLTVDYVQINADYRT